jgi:hypothetical protein
MAAEFTRLVDILRGIDSLPWRDGVYLPSYAPWSLESQGAVLSSSEFVADEEEPEFAKAHRLQFALSVHQIRQIVENARKQKVGLTDDDLFRAFLHYYDHDGFIEFK